MLALKRTGPETKNMKNIFWRDGGK